MKVIAKYKENIDWANQFEHFVVEKEVHLPNKGREASSYLWWILENYYKLPDEVHFLQGNPFDHCDGNFKSTWYPTSDKRGCPAHCGLRIEEISEPLNIKLPDTWVFPAGANFTVSREELLKYDYEWYQLAYKLSMEHEQGAWIFERLWGLIYDIIS